MNVSKWHREMDERRLALDAARLFTVCQAGALSIAIPLSGDMAPQCLNLITGKLEVMKNLA